MPSSLILQITKPRQLDTIEQHPAAMRSAIQHTQSRARTLDIELHRIRKISPTRETGIDDSYPQKIHAVQQARQLDPMRQTEASCLARHHHSRIVSWAEKSQRITFAVT
jgi:hypothetical protein